MPKWIKERDIKSLVAWAMSVFSVLLTALVGLGCYLYTSDQSSNKKMDSIILDQLSEIRKGQAEVVTTLIERQDKLRQHLTSIVSAEELDREAESSLLEGRVRIIENRVSSLETHAKINKYNNFNE